jgi:hypothetical protein
VTVFLKSELNYKRYILSSTLLWIHISQPANLANLVTVVFNFKWIKGPPDDDPIGIETCSWNKTTSTYNICIVNYFIVVLTVRSRIFCKVQCIRIVGAWLFQGLPETDWRTSHIARIGQEALYREDKCNMRVWNAKLCRKFELSSKRITPCVEEYL